MKPKISMVSLTVSDVARSLAFYRDGLGFPLHNYVEGDDFIMFRLEGSWLSIYPREEALKNLRAGALTYASVGLSHNVPSEADVREVLRAGPRRRRDRDRRPPQPAPWGGYEAAFADPDGIVWDIAMNPFTDLT